VKKYAFSNLLDMLGIRPGVISVFLKNIRKKTFWIWIAR